MTEWTDFYDGALHPDKSDPRDHDDIAPIAWRERITDQRRVSSGDAPPRTDDDNYEVDHEYVED